MLCYPALSVILCYYLLLYLSLILCLLGTVTYLIFAASKFGNFKRTGILEKLNFGIFFNLMPFKVFSILIGATLKEKNMLLMGTVSQNIRT